jgi:hypothetical protein
MNGRTRSFTVSSGCKSAPALISFLATSVYTCFTALKSRVAALGGLVLVELEIERAVEELGALAQCVEVSLRVYMVHDEHCCLDAVDSMG